jgi:hypothetical protein
MLSLGRLLKKALRYRAKSQRRKVVIHFLDSFNTFFAPSRLCAKQKSEFQYPVRGF